jgi:hypothetical protein
MEAHILTPESFNHFILAGKAIFTVRSEKTGTRFTFKVEKADKIFGSKQYYFCSVLTGTDNESDYRFFGTISQNIYNSQVFFTWSEKNKNIGINAPSVTAFSYIIKLFTEHKHNPNLHIFHEGRCGRCGRKLTVPESIENGIGPECIKYL